MIYGTPTSSILTVSSWQQQFPWLWHGFSTRAGGVSAAYSSQVRPCDLNLGMTADDDPVRVRENRQRLAEQASGSRTTPLLLVRQIHSAASVILRRDQPLWSEAPQADGCITDQPGILLAVQTADCIPVLVADVELRVVAAFHAGWRGTVQGVVEQGIAQMRADFGSQPQHLIAAIGPGIGPCCYAVGNDLVTEFAERFSYSDQLFRTTIDGAMSLDLVEANRRQLLASGITTEQIATLGGCTCCQPERFFSHRGQHGKTGRMMSVVGISASRAPNAA
jgi:YfiH family protein